MLLRLFLIPLLFFASNSYSSYLYLELFSAFLFYIMTSNSSKLSSPQIATAAAPSLPPRDAVATTAILPTKGGISGEPKRTTYGIGDSMSRVCVIRQYELYTSPKLNEASDLFTMNPDQRFSARKEDTEPAEEGGPIALVELTPDEMYWTRILNDFNNEVIRENAIGELEEAIIKGIPSEIRGAIYLKVMQIRYRFNNKESFTGLLRRAKAHPDSYVERVELVNRDAMRVFNYYMNEIQVSTLPEPVDKEDDDTPNTFIVHICRVLENVPGLTEENVLFLLLKFNKLFAQLIKDEFFYKLNRSMEEELHEVFTHVTMQGVNLINFYKKVLFNFFEGAVKDLVKVMDFVVFEGFDFVLRLIVWVFRVNAPKLMELAGDELNEFVNLPQFFDVDYVWSEILLQSPPIIKYENEYHLINIDSLNSNELRNLKEVNYDLNLKIGEIKKQLADLEVIHSEIVGQNDSIEAQVAEEERTKASLVAERAEYEARYENLTMKENLKNTIKANKEFAVRNRELEAQIADLRKGIEEKKAKLA